MASFTGIGRDSNRGAPDYEQEPTGAIAKDSLAAESIRRGGEFAENENAEPLGVRGDQSTLNTTDTSGATALHAARSGAQRERDDFAGLGSDERGHTGIRYPDADAPNETRGGAQNTYSSGSFGRGDDSSFDPDQVTSSALGATLKTTSDDDRAAPNYVGTVTGDIHQSGEFKPKGRNLVEGDVPVTKTFTGDVGGPNDPGRLAEQRFQQRNAEDIVESGDKQYRGDTGQGGQGDENPYDVLENRRA